MMTVHVRKWTPQITFSSDASGSWGCGRYMGKAMDPVPMAFSVGVKKHCGKGTVASGTSLCDLGPTLVSQKVQV